MTCVYVGIGKIPSQVFFSIPSLFSFKEYLRQRTLDDFPKKIIFGDATEDERNTGIMAAVEFLVELDIHKTIIPDDFQWEFIGNSESVGNHVRVVLDRYLTTRHKASEGGLTICH